MLSLFTSKAYKQRKLNEALEKLRDIPNINKGGCLVAAWAVWLYLKKHRALPKDFGIIALNQLHTEDLHTQNLNAIKGKDVPTASYHFAIKAFGKLYDVAGEIQNDNEFPLHLEITLSENFLKKAYFYGGWNEEYRKYEYNREIEKKLGIKFYP